MPPGPIRYDPQPDDSVPIVRWQLAKALGGTSKGKLMSVLNRPLNGVGNRPGGLCVGMDKVEPGYRRGDDGFGEEQRPGDGGGGFQKITTGWYLAPLEMVP
jgi:hypothetical protein